MLVVPHFLRWQFQLPQGPGPGFTSGTALSPGDPAVVRIWLENKSASYIALGSAQLQFDFGSYELTPRKKTVRPGSKELCCAERLSIPKNAVGQLTYRIKYQIRHWNGTSWVTEERTSESHLINSYPRPWYSIFLSRGLTPEDRAIGDPVVEMLREWALEPHTVGVDIKVDDAQVPEAIRRGIAQCSGLIAVLTPRYLDAIRGVWGAFPWSQAETGMAYAVKKPVLILKDQRVALSGLPLFLPEHVVEFNPFDLKSLRDNVSAIIPSFREAVAMQRTRQFNENLGKFALGAVMVGLGLRGLVSSSGATGDDA